MQVNQMDYAPDVLDKLSVEDAVQPSPRLDLFWLDRVGFHPGGATAIELHKALPEDADIDRELRLVSQRAALACML